MSDELKGNRFSLATDQPNAKVSWQVTGIRRDPWAKANRIEVEVAKTGKAKGRYLHPELYGKPASKAINPAPEVPKSPTPPSNGQ